MDDTHAAHNPLLVYVLYAQGQARQLITTIVPHGASVAQGDYHRGTYEGGTQVLKRRGETRHWELHDSGVLDELPAGKGWDCPHWTNGAVRVWDCGEQIPDPALPKRKPRSSPPYEDPRKRRWH